MKKQYNFIGNRKKFFIFSSVLIIIIFAWALIFGVQMDIQFKGGAMLSYSYTGTISESDVRSAAQDVLGSQVSVQTGKDIATGAQSITINMPGTQTVDSELVTKLTDDLNTKYPDNAFQQLQMVNVSPTMGKEFFGKCIVAVVVASLLILVYIAIRFKNIGGWTGGSMAVVALIHDLIMVFGVFVIGRIPLNGNFIAAALTILGYSINDTVVIYDRVRENRQLLGKSMPFDELMNLSINQSLRRSLNTTITTLLAIGTVCVVSIIYGLDSIFTFSFPLVIGMVSGVYSSVCIAGPLWVEWELHHDKNAQKKKKSAKHA